MTEQAMYKMLLRVFMRVGIYAHTLAEAEPMITSVCKVFFDNSSGEGNECEIIHLNKNLMSHR